MFSPDFLLALSSMFSSAFIAATLFPAASEVVLLALLPKYPHGMWLLCAVATLGNTLGGMTSYYLAMFCVKHPKLAKFTPSEQALARIRRFGTPILFFSWLPIVGDALCLAAGALKLSWHLSLIWIAIGKFTRYAIITLTTIGLL